MITRSALLVVAALALTAAACGQVLQYSTQDQRQFSFLGNPDHFYVRPGNDGYQIFTDAPSKHPGNLQPWQDEYCDARELVLESEDYSLSLHSSDTSVTAAYYSRLSEYMKGCSIEALLPCWVISSDFKAAWSRNPGLIDDVTSAALEFKRREYAIPLIVFDIPQWDTSADTLFEAFQTRLPGWPLAVRVRESNRQETRGHRWACVIADIEVVPELYRGQGIARWLHAQYGQVPVFVSPEKPDFLRETIWATAGVAGIWYRPLPEGDTTENRRAAAHLRASTVFFSRFGGEFVKMTTRPASGDFLFNFETEGQVWAGLLQSGTDEAVVEAPGWMVGHAVGGAWYNPATDENIIEPLTTASKEMTLKPPSSAMWLYSRTVTSLVPDTATTVTTINPWPD